MRVTEHRKDHPRPVEAVEEVREDEYVFATDDYFDFVERYRAPSSSLIGLDQFIR